MPLVIGFYIVVATFSQDMQDSLNAITVAGYPEKERAVRLSFLAAIAPWVGGLGAVGSLAVLISTHVLSSAFKNMSDAPKRKQANQLAIWIYDNYLYIHNSSVSPIHNCIFLKQSGKDLNFAFKAVCGQLTSQETNNKDGAWISLIPPGLWKIPIMQDYSLEQIIFIFSDNNGSIWIKYPQAHLKEVKIGTYSALASLQEPQNCSVFIRAATADAPVQPKPSLIVRQNL